MRALLGNNPPKDELVFAKCITALPKACWAAGVPPGPAAPPEGLRAERRFFALGLPDDLTIHERPARAAADGEDGRLSRLTIRRPTPLGNEELRAPVPSRPDLDGRYPTYRLTRTARAPRRSGRCCPVLGRPLAGPDPAGAHPVAAALRGDFRRTPRGRARHLPLRARSTTSRTGRRLTCACASGSPRGQSRKRRADRSPPAAIGTTREARW